MTSATLPSGLLLAVDGGNTKTDALVLDTTGRVLGVGRSGTSDIYAPAGEAAAYEQLRLAVDAAADSAGVRLTDLSGAALRLAGIDWPEDVATWRDWLSREFPAELPTSLGNDGIALLRCIDADGVGVSLTVGTSYAVGARGDDGTVWSLNNWGQHHLGAIGLGLDAYRAAMLAELGFGPPTALTERLLAHAGLGSADELVHAVTRRHNTYTLQSYALMAPDVTAVAAAGDPVAVEIVEQQGRTLTGYLRLAADRVGLDHDFAVVVDGSVVRAEGSVVWAALQRHLVEGLPHARLVTAGLPPVAGVAFDALAEAGVRPDGDVRARVAAQFVGA